MTHFLIGHRGAMGLAPENTLKSFRVGCENGADIVECDVRLSRDGHLVVIHDSQLKRTTNGKGRVHRYTLEQLRRFDAGDGEKIPTLLEVMELVKAYQKMLIIEIKAGSRKSAAKTARAVAQFIREHDLSKSVIVYSFWKIAVKVVKEMVPDVSTAVLYARILRAKQMIKHLHRIGADGVCIAHKYITDDIVQLLRDHDLFLDTWGMNDLMTFEQMQEMGVRGLSTDYPGSLV